MLYIAPCTIVIFIMLDSAIEFLQTLPWWGVLLFAFLLPLIENIFPPSPSDVLLVFIGTLVGLGTVGLPETIVLAAIGSTIGFIIMFRAGQTLDRSVIESGKYKFIPTDTIHKAEHWFQKYGYAIIIANRFLSGTRAVISLFAGMSQLNFAKTTVLSFVSSLLWNGIIIYLGMILGKNWRQVEDYMTTYGSIITIVVGVVVAIFLIRFFWIKRIK